VKIELEVVEMFGKNDWTCSSSDYSRESLEVFGEGKTPASAISNWHTNNTEYLEQLSNAAMDDSNE